MQKKNVIEMEKGESDVETRILEDDLWGHDTCRAVGSYSE
jgi:hypothetical protein